MLITARYVSRCTSCGKSVPTGARAVWSQIDRLRCLACVPDWRSHESPADRIQRELELSANQSADPRSTYRRKVRHR